MPLHYPIPFRFLVAIVTLHGPALVQAQAPPSVEWHRMYGGSAIEAVPCIITTIDGGSLAEGRSTSNDGDVMGHHGGLVDQLVIKMDVNGDIEWSRLYGGTQSEGAAAVIQSSSGDYACIGRCNSEDGDAEGPGKGLQDVWILRTDPDGDILWQRKYGGPLNDVATAIRQTGDGGFLFTASVGSSTSGGDLLPGLGGYWLVKLNSTGEILWQNRFGQGYRLLIPSRASR